MRQNGHIAETPQQMTPRQNNDGRHLSAWLEGVCKQWRQPGLAITVASSDGVSFANGGVRKAGGADMVDPSTLFAAASISKTFAAATIGVLVDCGALSLDDRVKRYLPQFRLADPWVSDEITVRDLLCNRIGVESSEGRHRRCAASRTDLIARMDKQRFRHSFRAGYGYCSDAFTCAGAVVEAVSRQSWEDFAQETIWAPLGMTRTNANHKTSRTDPNAASPHLLSNGAPTPILWAYEEAATPAGGVNTCTLDLAAWLQAMLNKGAANNNRILSEDMIRELTTPHTVERGPYREDEMACVIGLGAEGVEAPSYALGWYRHSYRGAAVCYHTGSIDGFRSIIGMLPDHDFGVAILANADNAYLPRAVFQHLVDERLGFCDRDWLEEFRSHQTTFNVHADRQALASAPPKTNAPCPAPLASLCGSYKDETGFGDAEVVLHADQLILKAGAASYDLFHWDGLVFEVASRAPYTPLRRFFATWTLDTDGRPVHLSTTQGALFAYRN
ncbi:MAG: serine hydrolase [Pseudomonadota bacterium]